MNKNIGITNECIFINEMKQNVNPEKKQNKEKPSIKTIDFELYA